MHPQHAALLEKVRIAAGPPRGPGGTLQNDSYGGSGRPYYLLPVPDRRRLAREWARAHPSAAEVLAVAESLITLGVSHEEKSLGAILIGQAPAARRAVTPAKIEAWLGALNGWAEVDSLCANLFKAEDMAADWPAWSGLIQRLRVSADVNRRRASLVLLTGPVRYSDDPRFAGLAFETIDGLKAERDALITKAVSWLLREMCGRHGAAVAAFLGAEAGTLPAIALRETRVKLATGTKSGKRRGAGTA
jgi:3-methyladenine DNA glycosylase AlkD